MDMEIIERLRKLDRSAESWSEYYAYDMEVLKEAADEIERLRAALKEISELGDVRADEAGTIAAKALNQQLGKSDG